MRRTKPDSQENDTSAGEVCGGRFWGLEEDGAGYRQTFVSAASCRIYCCILMTPCTIKDLEPTQDGEGLVESLGGTPT
jgi:hypothetical protein